jgi:hypothetical protein
LTSTTHPYGDTAKEKTMDVVMKELFGSDIGLLSLFTIGFIIAMGLFMWYKFTKNANEKD